MSFRWAPSRAHGHSAEPAKAKGLPEAHGPPKVHGPRGHCTPLPPLSAPLVSLLVACDWLSGHGT